MMWEKFDEAIYKMEENENSRQIYGKDDYAKMVKSENIAWITVGVMAVIILIICGVLALQTPEYKTTTVPHRVAAGETLWEIASVYMEEQNKTSDIREFIYDIKTYNHLPNSGVRSGQLIEIPLNVK